MRSLMAVVLALALLLPAVGPAAAQGGPRTYQVRSGDTWTSVARRLGVPMCRLALANGHVRCSSVYRASARLMVGQTLNVPVRVVR